MKKPFCPDCGYTMKADELRDVWHCPSCKLSRNGMDVACEPAPNVHHGIRCDGCDGTGSIEEEFTDWHPYGDTTVPETLAHDVDCDDCFGKGYFLDEDSCIGCGDTVADGILVDGWEVCEACSGDDLPQLEGFD